MFKTQQDWGNEKEKDSTKLINAGETDINDPSKDSSIVSTNEHVPSIQNNNEVTPVKVGKSFRTRA